MSDTRPCDIETDMAAIAESRRVRLETDPRCGTCRHWRPFSDLAKVGVCGWASANLPPAVATTATYASHGATCATWAAIAAPEPLTQAEDAPWA